MVITTILNVNISRILNIGIITYFVNKTRSSANKVTPKFQFVMWISGLRGAMAYALDMKASTDFAIGPVILITTLIYSLISILVVGSFMNPLFKKINIKK